MFANLPWSISRHGGRYQHRCRAGNRQDARTIMADPGDCATTTAVALKPPAGSHEEAALLTPEKEKPPRLVWPRIKPVGDRIRTAEEVG